MGKNFGVFGMVVLGVMVMLGLLKHFVDLQVAEIERRDGVVVTAPPSPTARPAPNAVTELPPRALSEAEKPETTPSQPATPPQTAEPDAAPSNDTNDYETVTLSAFGTTLSRDLAARGARLGIDTSGYGDTIRLIRSYVAGCAQFDEDAVVDMDRCDAGGIGKLYATMPRPVYVRLHLRTRSTPYSATVQFAAADDPGVENDDEGAENAAFATNGIGRYTFPQ